MVVGDGSKFDDAYFEISYIRAYTTGGPVPTSPIAVAQPATSIPVTTTITAAMTTTTATFNNATSLRTAETTTSTSGAGNSQSSSSNNDGARACVGWLQVVLGMMAVVANGVL